MIQLLPVVFVHLVADDIAEQGADCGTDQGCFGAAADGLAGDGPTRRADSGTLSPLTVLIGTGGRVKAIMTGSKNSDIFSFPFP